jgi:hypothetical protein
MEVSDGGQRRFERKTQPIISANRFDGLSCYIEHEGILVRRKMSSFPDVRLAMQLFEQLQRLLYSENCRAPQGRLVHELDPRAPSEHCRATRVGL